MNQLLDKSQANPHSQSLDTQPASPTSPDALLADTQNRSSQSGPSSDVIEIDPTLQCGQKSLSQQSRPICDAGNQFPSPARDAANANKTMLPPQRPQQMPQRHPQQPAQQSQQQQHRQPPSSQQQPPPNVPGDWNLAGSKKKRRKQNQSKPAVKIDDGNGPLSGFKPKHEGGPLSGHKRIQTADMYLSNIKRFPSDTWKNIADRVRQHCAERDMRVIYARVFPNRYSKQFVGCRIVIPATQADDALSNRMWPADVMCRRWKDNNKETNTNTQHNQNTNHNKSYADLRYDTRNQYDEHYGGRYREQSQQNRDYHYEHSYDHYHHDTTENWETTRDETPEDWYQGYDDRSRSRNDF